MPSYHVYFVHPVSLDLAHSLPVRIAEVQESLESPSSPRGPHLNGPLLLVDRDHFAQALP